jgi:hypothetical protein
MGFKKSWKAFFSWFTGTSWPFEIFLIVLAVVFWWWIFQDTASLRERRPGICSRVNWILWSICWRIWRFSRLGPFCRLHLSILGSFRMSFSRFRSFFRHFLEFWCSLLLFNCLRHFHTKTLSSDSPFFSLDSFFQAISYEFHFLMLPFEKKEVLRLHLGLKLLELPSKCGSYFHTHYLKSTFECFWDSGF